MICLWSPFRNETDVRVREERDSVFGNWNRAHGRPAFFDVPDDDDDDDGIAENYRSSPSNIRFGDDTPTHDFVLCAFRIAFNVKQSRASV